MFPLELLTLQAGCVLYARGSLSCRSRRKSLCRLVLWRPHHPAKDPLQPLVSPKAPCTKAIALVDHKELTKRFLLSRSVIRGKLSCRDRQADNLLQPVSLLKVSTRFRPKIVVGLC